MSERKQYEDLSLEQRFTCDVSQIFDTIAQFGEGSYARLKYFTVSLLHVELLDECGFVNADC